MRLLIKLRSVAFLKFRLLTENKTWWPNKEDSGTLKYWKRIGWIKICEPFEKTRSMRLFPERLEERLSFFLYQPLRFVTFLARNRKFFSAFSTPCSYNPAAAWSWHTLTETMFVSSFAIWGLKCPFHYLKIGLGVQIYVKCTNTPKYILKCWRREGVSVMAYW